MDDEKMFVRSFGREKLAFRPFIGCFIVVVNLCLLLKPFVDLPPIYFVHKESTIPIIRNFTNFRSDVYEITGDIRIHGPSSTIFVASTQYQTLNSLTIKPYGHKWLNTTKNTTYFTLKMDAANRLPHCNRNFRNIPAVLFTGRVNDDNHFHEFADVLFPLFSTSHHFNGRVIFLITYYHPPWISKYRAILEKLSQHRVFDIDNEDKVLCFSRVTVGLKGPKSLFIHPSESANFSMMNFTSLIRNAYSLERESRHDLLKQPRMLIVSRRNNRRLMNEHEVVNLARSMGFDVVAKQVTSELSLVAELVNSFDVMVGVHGAGLTNMVFLPGNALVVQIVPYGVELEAKICFQWAAECMGLRYLEYKVTLNESSLLGKYPLDNEVYRNPIRVRNISYDLFHAVYFQDQDVYLDLDRFRKTMLKVLEILAT